MGLWEMINAGICSLLVLVLCYLITLGIKFFKPSSGSAVVDSIFECVSKVITETAAATVGKLEQIIGKDLRKLVKEGKADKNELYALAEDAYREIVKTVSPEIMNSLGKYIGDKELYIRNVIEAELLKLKSNIKV